VALLRLERDELTVFPAEARKKKDGGGTWRSRRAKTPRPRVSVCANVKAERSNVPLCAVNQSTKSEGMIMIDHKDVVARRACTEPITWAGHAFTPPMSSASLSISQTIRAHNAALTNLYFHHRETVLHIQSTLRTQILPNVLDELALGNSAQDWAQEWLQDERKFLLGSVLKQRVFHLFSKTIKVSIFRILKVRM
jgi:hypothetical protein